LFPFLSWVFFFFFLGHLDLFKEDQWLSRIIELSRLERHRVEILNELCEFDSVP